MSLFSIVLIALGLSADCFAAALGGSVSSREASRLQVLRTSLAFGFFQALMPILGWLAGRTIEERISAYDHWVAFALLALVGGRMIRESRRPAESRAEGTDITRGILLLTVSVATSIDALAVGLGFAFLAIDILAAALIIGIVAFFVTVIGFWLGRKAGRLLGARAKFAGGAILILIGLRVLLTHML